MIYLMIAVVLVGFFLAVARLVGTKSQAFQAAAHLFVGFLIGWAVFGEWIFPTVTVVVLSVVEVFAFARDRVFRKKSTTLVTDH